MNYLQVDWKWTLEGLDWVLMIVQEARNCWQVVVGWRLTRAADSVSVVAWSIERGPQMQMWLVAVG